MRKGESFEDRRVAECYRHRPEYPGAVFSQLVNVCHDTSHVLDLGCGTGKIARGLSRYFKQVTALDPSTEMLRVAGSLPLGDAKNIAWINGLAESCELPADIDLVVAAASIHWMDHTILFPKLREVVKQAHVFATVDGDGAYKPAWDVEWNDFLKKWILELRGEHFEPDKKDSEFHLRMIRHRDWIEVIDATIAETDVVQTIDEFISCQHSRDTFAHYKLGTRVEAFDKELRELLQPFAINDQITYKVRTRVEWGTIKF